MSYKELKSHHLNQILGLRVYRTIIFIIIDFYLDQKIFISIKMRLPAPPSVHCLANISSLGLSEDIVDNQF